MLTPILSLFILIAIIWIVSHYVERFYGEIQDCYGIIKDIKLLENEVYTFSIMGQRSGKQTSFLIKKSQFKDDLSNIEGHEMHLKYRKDGIWGKIHVIDYKVSNTKYK